MPSNNDDARPSVTRNAPSPLWDVSPEKRQEFLAKRDRHGRPVWTLQQLTPEEVLQRPPATTEQVEIGTAWLLAELREDAITAECARCSAPMSPMRAVQVCEGCATGAEKRLAS